MTQNNEREAVNSIEFNDIALKQQSEAWQAVCCALDEVKPNWMGSNLPAMECAVNAIKELAQSPISQNEQQPKQIPDGCKLVPIESDEQMKDGARAFLTGLELGVKTFENMSEHLRLSGAYLPDWFLKSKGHINKMAKAHYIYEAMLNASPTNTEVGE